MVPGMACQPSSKALGPRGDPPLPPGPLAAPSRASTSTPSCARPSTPNTTAASAARCRRTSGFPQRHRLPDDGARPARHRARNFLPADGSPVGSRLPRAGATTRFNLGGGLYPTAPAGEGCETTTERADKMRCSGDNTPVDTKQVGQRLSNARGLRDMHGNVWEWRPDWHGAHGMLGTENPSGATTGAHRVIRGSARHEGVSVCRWPSASPTARWARATSSASVSSQSGDCEPSSKGLPSLFELRRVGLGGVRAWR